MQIADWRLFFAAGAAILAVAAWMRTADLSAAPLHFDEATQARIAAAHFSPSGGAGGETAFNPRHFHGPLPGWTVAATAQIAGENSWLTLTKHTLRIIPALSGIAVVLMILAAAPLIGRLAALLAAAFAAVSPFLVHYSRLFIHEDLLVFFLAGALLLLGFHVRFRAPLWTVGICLGLAAATKATFALTLLTWALAGACIYRPPWAWLRSRVPQLAGLGASFLAVVVLFYSEFGRHPGGVWDFLSTYWSYETGEGHDKPLLYYANLFLLPSHHGRLWWWQGGIFLLGLLSVFQKPGATPVAAAARFCFLAGLLQAGAYSLLPYKTPWLMLVPWLHVIIAAGIGAAGLLRARSIPASAGIAALLAALLVFQGLQAWRVAFRYPSDLRNPFAYVPTSPGVETWTRRSIQWLRDGGWLDETVSVIGPRYWPLPWYFRGLKVGYWPAPPDGISSHALVVAMPEFAPSLSERLAGSHVAIPEGLRADTPVLLFVRNDIWEKSTGVSP